VIIQQEISKLNSI